MIKVSAGALLSNYSRWSERTMMSLLDDFRLTCGLHVRLFGEIDVVVQHKTAPIFAQLFPSLN
jgi:hypothetical protein